MRNSVYAILALLLIASPLQAQSRMSGQAVDDAGRSIGFVNVQLLEAADSSFVLGTIADDAGQFLLEGVRPGEYLLYVSLIGYRDHLSEPLRIGGSDELDVGSIRLEVRAIEMAELSVEARRTLYEQKGNRLVVNVGTSIGLAGGSALDILKRSPGVVVNEQSGSVSMLGKDGVRVMIDGKPRYMENEAMIAFLEGLSADNIDSIELITSPPADMDAEGNAGFINIVLKRSGEEGLNGSIATSAGYGFGHGGVGSGSADVNYRQRGLSFYGSYSFLWDSQQQRLVNYRSITNTDKVTEFPARSQRDPVRRTHNFRFGADYDVSETTSVGALVSGYQNKFDMDAFTDLTIITDGAPVMRSESVIDMFNRWRHIMGNISVRYKPRAGTSFGADLDHLRYHNAMPTSNVNTSTPVGSGSATEMRLSSGKKTPLAITVAKLDYNTRIGGLDIGAGAKAAFSRFTNRMSFSAAAKRDWMSDHALSTRSVLREDVWAAYARSATRPSSSSSLELGLRYEYTDTELDTQEKAGIVDRRWGRLFPSAVYTYEINDDLKSSLSYTRRVTRPAFNDLASFSRFDDPYTLFTGNPGLQPAVTDAAKLDITYRSLLASLEYAREDSSIARFQSRIVPGTDVQVIFPTNFHYVSSLTALVGIPAEFASWWTTQSNVTVTRQHVDGTRNGAAMQMDRTFFRFNSTQNVSLPFGLKLEANGFFQSTTLLGAIRWEPMWGANVALQRTLPAGAVTFAVDDLFDSVEWQWITGSPRDPLYAEQIIDMSHRTFRFTYSRRFGHGDAQRVRSRASEAESRRVVD